MSTSQPSAHGNAPGTTASDDSGVVVRNLARAFGEVHAVRDVSFTASAGAVTALIGPNGSGKTTLMLMLASLLRPDAGSIRVAGADPVINPRGVRAVLGWMPDALGSWDSLTVRSALYTTGRMYGMDRVTAVARAKDLIVLTGLSDLAARPTRVLSRGQKQKLSLARALVHDPKVLLLDEPASGLDPLARVELQTLVRGLASEGKTILVSSHVLAELDVMADAAVFVDSGVSASAERVAESRVAKRAWRVRTTAPSELARTLEKLGFATAEITVDRGETSVPIVGDAEAAELLAKLVKAGIPVSSFAPAVGDLEHAFLDLSRGADSPTGPGTTGKKGGKR